VDCLAAVLLLTAVMVVACLGDSITEGSPYWDSRRATGVAEGQWEHWASLRNPQLTFRNHGIGGERTDQIAQRFEEAVAGADVLVVQGGINDLADGRDVESAAANLRALVERGRDRGLPVAVCDVLPWNNGWPEQEQPIRELNALIADLPVPLLSFHDTLEDPERPGRMKEEWTNEDGNHPSLAGYRRLGELAFHPFWSS
jgi:lysophospholipase L1-like esterase